MTGRIRSSCDQCSKSKLKCGGEKPICHRCSCRNRPCSYSQIRSAGRPRRARASPTMASGDVSEVVEGNSQPISTRRGSPSAASTVSLHPSTIADVSELSDHFDFNMTESTLDSESFNFDTLDPLLGGTTILDCTEPEAVNTSHRDPIQDDLQDQGTLAQPQSLTLLPTLAVDQEQSLSFSIGDEFSSITIAGLESAFDLSMSSYQHCDSAMGLRQSSKVASEHLSFPPTQAPRNHLRIYFEELLNDTKTCTMLERLIDPVACQNRTNFDPNTRGRLFDTTDADGLITSFVCRCTMLLNRLQIIAMHPELSPSSKLIPLDLALFTEEALQETEQEMAGCAVCSSSPLSANKVILCLVADWVVNCLQGILERELNTSTTAKARCLQMSSLGHQGASKGEWMEQQRGANKATPSIDRKNILRVGTWVVCKEFWTPCVSMLLSRRISRLRRMLCKIGAENFDLLQRAAPSVTTRTASDMASMVRCKIDLLSGMIEIWASGFRCESLHSCQNSTHDS
ncbi:hypothetical protein F5X99DRAFT_425536 [Biscogniauxia marginata]|nr:hypothetical protein F5X99DRAFT_425536 [Biscogniauxia marginata]